jgi:hypothetical protein
MLWFFYITFPRIVGVQTGPGNTDFSAYPTKAW